jgi:hypothetical protein
MRNIFPLARRVRGATPALAHPLAALGLLLATAGAAQAQTTTRFSFTAPGSPQTYTVPAGITKLNVVATGAAGGGNRGNTAGGLGAVVQATVTVVPGEVLTVVVGGQGADSNNNGTSSVGGAGGYNGGGNGSYTGGGGGGATDLRRATATGSTGDYFTSRNALLVAGGGGGGDAFSAPGGAAGTPTGGNGGSGQGGSAGQGATTTALGGGYLGSNGTGGNGNPSNFNAAGGGGYYGGGGGGGPAGGGYNPGVNGGGGGSSYVLPTGSSNVNYALAASRTNGALAITTVPTPTNNALAFDGSDDYVSLPTSTPVPVGNSTYTIEAWIKPTSMGVYGIVGWGTYGTTNQVNALRLSPTGIINYWWGADLVVNTPDLSGQWHHVAATFDGTTRTIYLDGVAKGSDTPGAHTVPNANNLRIGSTNSANGGNGEYFPGSIDEVRIYNVGLTQAQVQADMFSTTAAVPANQQYYANFDQGTASGNNAGLTSLTDQSGNNSTGTLNNFALTSTSSNFVRSFPTITGIAPTSGNIGSSVVLTGTNLTDATGFAFNGTAVSPFTTPSGDLTATVTVPSGATTGPVSVSSATLTTYNGPTFTVTYPDLVVTTTATVPAGTYNSITVNSPGVATLAGNVTVNTSTTVNSGATLNDGCNVLSGAGSFTLAAGGTLGICSADGIAASGATGAIQNTGTRSFAGDASYIYNGTAAQVTGAGLPSQVRNLTSTNSSTVTLSQAVSVAQAVTLNAGNLGLSGRTLTLLSNASGTALVANLGAGFISGTTVAVQRYIDPSLNAGLGYRHLVAPVTAATVASFGSGGTTPVVNSAYNSASAPGTVTPFPTIYRYDQSRLATSPATTLSTFDKGWVSPASLSDAANLASTGFTVQLPGASTLSFTGQVGNSTGSIPLSRASGATAADAGLNLIGNPYPSPLDFSTITAAQRTNMDAAFYVFESTSQYGGAYRSYVNGVASTGGSSLVGTAQAFFVRVTAGQTDGSLALNNGNRITTYSQQAAVRRTAAETRPLVRLALQGASGLADGFVAYAQAGATAGFDGEYDAAKLPNSTGLNLSSATATGSLSIDGRAAFTAATVLALNVGVPAAGTYALSAADIANLPAGLTATLRDAATGQTTPLAAGTAYSFSVTATEATALLAGRFTLQFSSASPLATAASLVATDVTVYPNPAHGRFTVLVPAVASAPAVQAELLNTLGQVVRRQSAALPAAGATLTVETAGLAAGVYTLRLTAGASTLAKRVVLQ